MLYSFPEIGESFFFEPKAWYEAFSAMHPVELQGVKEMLNLRSFPPTLTYELVKLCTFR